MPPKKHKPEKWFRVRWSSAKPDTCFVHREDGDRVHVSKKESGGVSSELIDSGYVSYHRTYPEALAHKKEVLVKVMQQMETSGGCAASYRKQLEELEKANEEECN